MNKKNNPTDTRPIIKIPVAFLILLIGSIAGGLIVSGIIGAIAWQIVKNITPSSDVLIGTVGFILLGYPAGNIIGILILNKWLRLVGSLTWGIPACILGTICVLGLAELLNINALTTLIILSLIAPLCGTLGFLLAKRKTKR